MSNKTPKDQWTMKDTARWYDVTYNTIKRWKRVKDPRLHVVADTPGRGVRIWPPVTSTTTSTK
jgi:hypothetical protein